MSTKIPRKKTHYSFFSVLVLTLWTTLSSFAWAAEPAKPDRALFWEIIESDRSVGYLLGTIHSEDPRVLEFSDEFIVLLNSNEIFAMEMVPDLPTLAKLTEYMHFPPGQDLPSVIGGERYDALVKALSGYSMPENFISRMKPWAAMMTLSTPPPVTGFFMDLSLSLRASGSGLKVVGLETLEQQLSFLQDMPLDLQLSLLDQAIADFDQVQQVHDEMVGIYLKADLEELQSLAYEQMQEVGKDARDYFMQTGIIDRNFRMFESLKAQLPHGRVFAAVGALHLAGETGLIELLRAAGYQMKPLPLPFPSVEN